jgi:hypothetical protein
MVVVGRPPTPPQNPGLLRVRAWLTLPWPAPVPLVLGVFASSFVSGATAGVELGIHWAHLAHSGPHGWFAVPLAVGALLGATLLAHRRVRISATPHYVEIGRERIAWEDVRLAQWQLASQEIRLRDGRRRVWRLWLSEADGAALALATAAALVPRKPRALDAERDLRRLVAHRGGAPDAHGEGGGSPATFTGRG